MHSMEPLESRRLFSGSPHLALGAGQLAFDQVQGNLSAPQTITLKNTGSGRLRISSITLDGADAAQFILGGVNPRRMTLGRGASIKLTLKFRPSIVALSAANLQITSNDPAAPLTSVPIRGLGLAGFYGTNEPSLQRIFDALQIPLQAGDSTPMTRGLDGIGPSDEVAMQTFKKAGTGLVTISTLAIFSWNTNPVATIGWYTNDGKIAAHQLFSVPLGSGQAFAPPAYGAQKFDPKTASFGLFGNWPSEAHTTFSQDALNTWYKLNNQHAVRVYPYKTPKGQVVANSFVVALEQGADNDYNDAVLLIQNVTLGA